MKVAYLHIGPPKTGTTSLQHFLAENREALEKQRVCYPKTEFTYPDVGENRNGHFLVHPHYTDNGKADRTRPSADYKAGLDRVEQLAENCDTVILSDEAIFYYSQYRPDFWSQLKEDFARRGFLMKVIIYLRRQDLLLESLYSQRIKKRFYKKAFNQFSEEIINSKPPAFMLDYHAYLDNIAPDIGRENLIVRVFETGQFGGAERSLHSDFLQIIGLSLDGLEIDHEIFNSRMGGGYLELKRILNYLPDNRQESNLIAYVMRDLIDIPHPGYTPGEKCSFMKPDERKALLERFEESNRQTAREYLGREDGLLFREPVIDYPLFSVSDHDLLRCAIVAYGKTLEGINAKVRSQRAEITSLRNQLTSLRDATLMGRMKKYAKKVLGRSVGSS